MMHLLENKRLIITKLAWLVACVAGIAVLFSLAGRVGGSFLVHRKDNVVPYLENSIREYLRKNNLKPKDPFIHGLAIRKKGDDIRRCMWVTEEHEDNAPGKIKIGFTAAYFWKDGIEKEEGVVEISGQLKNDENIDLVKTLSSKSEKLIQEVATKYNLLVIKEKAIRRFLNGSIGAVLIRWEITILESESAASIAASIVREYYREVVNASDLEPDPNEGNL